MSDTIPGKIIRKIISDIIFERANAIDNTCNEIMENEMSTIGVITDYACEVGVTACGTRVLADDVLDGSISIEEAVDILTADEKKKPKLDVKSG